jgi:hypothetical protein
LCRTTSSSVVAAAVRQFCPRNRTAKVRPISRGHRRIFRWTRTDRRLRPSTRTALAEVVDEAEKVIPFVGGLVFQLMGKARVDGDDRKSKPERFNRLASRGFLSKSKRQGLPIVARQSFCLLGFFLSSSSFVAATAETCVRARSKAGLGVDARLRRHVAQRCVKEAMLKVALLSSYRSREVETSSVPTYEKGHSVVSLLSKCWTT